MIGNDEPSVSNGAVTEAPAIRRRLRIQGKTPMVNFVVDEFETGNGLLCPRPLTSCGVVELDDALRALRRIAWWQRAEFYDRN